MAKFYRFQDDFVAPLLDSANARLHSQQKWTYGNGAGAGVPSIQSSVAGAPGLLRLSTGTTINDDIRFHTASATAGMFIPDDVERFKFRLSLTTSTNVRLRFGLGEDISAADFGTHGLFAQYDTSIVSNVRSISRLASASTNSPTGHVPSTSLFSLEWVRASNSLWHVYITSAGVRFYAGSHTTNLPTTQAMPLGIFVQTLTGAARSVNVDLVELNSKELTLR